VIFNAFFEYLFKNDIISERYDWTAEFDVSLPCYDENMSLITIMHTAELISKSENIDIDDINYEEWSIKTFLQLASLFIEVNKNI
jgi:hypothetical protein